MIDVCGILCVASLDGRDYKRGMSERSAAWLAH
jgi:hypothetical protein